MQGQLQVSFRLPMMNLLKCRHCQSGVGFYTAVALIVGSVKFLRPVTMQCLHCGRTIKWRPFQTSGEYRVDATKDVASTPLEEYNCYESSAS